MGSFQLSQHDLTSLPKFAICIAGRPSFNEQHLHFPVRTRNELKKLLKLKFSSSRFYYQANKSLTSGYEVVVWTPNNFESSSFITVPVAWLVAKQLEESSVSELSSPSGHFYVGNKNGLSYSAAKTALLATPEIFAQSIGVVSRDVKVVDCKQFIAGLIESNRLINRGFWSFLNVSEDASDFEIQVKDVLPSCILAGLYLAGSSIYLEVKEQNLLTQLDKQKIEVTDSLENRTKFEENQNELQELEQLFDSELSHSQTWLLVNFLLEKDATLSYRAFRNKETEYTLIGQSERAIQTLTYISEWPGVSEARFITPVRKNGDREAFNISFKFLEVVNE
ncbi:hypothetical protein [Pseudoalteromonas xiamenensis]